MKKDAWVWAKTIQKDPTQSKGLQIHGMARAVSKFSRKFIRTARASPYEYSIITPYLSLQK